MKIMKMYKGFDLVRANLENYLYVTINPTPSDALVYFSCTGSIKDGNTIIVQYGSEITYKVSKIGYQPIISSIIVTDNMDINIELQEYKEIRFNASTQLQEYIVPNYVTKLAIDCVASRGFNYSSQYGTAEKVEEFSAI